MMTTDLESTITDSTTPPSSPPPFAHASTAQMDREGIEKVIPKFESIDSSTKITPNISQLSPTSPATLSIPPTLTTPAYSTSTSDLETDPHFSSTFSIPTRIKSLTPPPLPPAIISDSPEPLFSPPSESIENKVEEGDEEGAVQELIYIKTLEEDLVSPLFPSPSSSFRPPPTDLELDIVTNLDKRIMLEKAKRDSLNNEGGIIPQEEADEEEETVLYDVTPTPLSPLFPLPIHPEFHPDPNASSLPPLDETEEIISRPNSTPGYFTPTTLSNSTFVSTTSSHSNPSSIGTNSAAISVGFVFVRDFAFEKEDPRFKGGRHPDQDLCSSTRNQHDGDQEEEEEERGELSPKVGNEDFSTSGSSGFSWGFVTSHQTDFQSEDESQNASETDEDESLHPSHQVSSSSPTTTLDGAEDGRFIAGRYQALYDFLPESGTEMKLNAGEVILVYSRQCVGWVQAEKIDRSTGLSDDMGLVPENYLALLEPDPSITTYSHQDQTQENENGNENEEDEEWEEEDEEDDDDEVEGGDERELEGVEEDGGENTEEEGNDLSKGTSITSMSMVIPPFKAKEVEVDLLTTPKIPHPIVESVVEEKLVECSVLEGGGGGEEIPLTGAVIA